MTKKQNTIVFIIVGTLVSVILTILIGGILILLSLLLFKENQNAFMIAFAVSLIGSMFLSMLVYQKLVYWVIKKFNLGDKLDPLFVKKQKKN
ncbi:MAG: leader peptide processing enzyme [Spirochaetaceae bacterium]|nr:leader peptide processing enzyme [Spirochaetaceae bacterium]